MPPRRSTRQSLPTASPRAPVTDIVVISSDDEQRPSIVPETPSPRASARPPRSAVLSARTSIANSSTTTPATGRSSRTTSTHASGSHTPATSVEGDSEDDSKTKNDVGQSTFENPISIHSQDSASASTTRESRQRRAKQSATAAIKVDPDTEAETDVSSILGSVDVSRKRKGKKEDAVLNQFTLAPSKAQPAISRSQTKRHKTEGDSDVKNVKTDVLDVLNPERDNSESESATLLKGKGKLVILDPEDEEDDDEDKPLANFKPLHRQDSSGTKGTKFRSRGSVTSGFDDPKPDDTDEDDVPLAIRYKKPDLGMESDDDLTYFGSDSDSDRELNLVSRPTRAGAIVDEDSDETEDEFAYETAKQKQKRLRSEHHKSRLKRIDHRTLYDKNQEKLVAHHPELKTVWEDLQKTIAIIKPQKAEQPKGMNISLLPFQLEGLYWMTRQETGPWKGGLLADEMGMGKTIQMISLMLVDRKKPCLVVAPTVAIMQWRNEIQKYTDPQLSVILWHGQTRTQSIKEIEGADVVLTSFAVLESCFRKQESGFRRKHELVKEKSVLHAVHWRRIILDEAHNIKERSTNTAKGAFALKGDFRWCLSGTPLQNRVGELYSMIRFLGGDPFAYYYCKKCPCKSLHWSFSDRRNCDSCGHTPMHHTCYWNNEILKPIQRSGSADGEGADAFKRLRLLLERVMLRRTKLERADDMGLPPRTVEVRRDLFNEEEEDLYTSLYTDTTRKFSTYLDHGTVLNNYSNIFTLLTRMRQLANHPDLVLRSKTGVASKLLGDDQSEIHVCRLCTDEAEDAIMSRCKHIFCRECVRQYLDTELEPGAIPDCPHCHATLSIDLEAEALEPPLSTIKMNDNGRQGILARLDMDKWRSSTKIEALVEELTQMRSDDKTIKSLVFSQFVNFLDLIAFRLQRAGFSICRLEGNMSPEARNRTIKHFMENPNVTVFLVSLKAGGVALNLTEASRVYLMDPWWNPSVEVQAMDRIHRLGQHRPIIVKRMVIENSIESRIIELQNKKSAMIEAAIGKDDAAMGRLSVSDLRFLFTL